MNIYLLVVAGYFLLITVLAILTKKLAARSSADYLIAGRNLGVIACAVVVASEWLGGMSTIGVSELAFGTGTIQPVLYNISTALGMIIIGFTVARYYRSNQVHTVSEMLELLFGARARAISAVAFLLAYVTLAFVQLQTCASVLSAMFGLSWLNAILLSALVITVYTYYGGMHALALTGIIHVAVMFLGVGIAAVIGLVDVEGLAALRSELVTLGAPENLYNPFSGGIGYAWSLIIGGVLGGMAGQASIQPIFAARSASVARKAAVLSALIIAPFGILVALLGLIARTGRYFDPQPYLQDSQMIKMVLPMLMTTPEFIHPVLGGMALAGILAAILSTVGPVNFAVVTIATKDIYHGLINKTAPDAALVITARRLVLLVNAVTIPLAYFGTGAILDTAYISYGVRAIGAVVIVMGIYLRGWIRVEGVRFAFVGGTVALLGNILLSWTGLPSLEHTYAALGAGLLFIVIGNTYGRLRGREDVITDNKRDTRL